IPAYNEFPGIIETLQSLSLSSATCKVKVEAVICVNNRDDSPIEIKQNNQYLVEMLHRISQNEFFVEENSTCGVKITVLDFTDGENQFKKGYGVGWARKIAMDYALQGGAEVLACLDADTLVSLDYCGELERFRKEKMDFATMDFIHQGAETSELQEAINCYEYWMKDHSKKLYETKTPFHYMALGSLIVVSDLLYCQIGGMKNRLAGEDFYFIQEAIKILLTRMKSIEELRNAVPRLSCQVYPEARLSERVLFGTGKSLASMESGSKKVRFYLDSSYEQIRKFIEIFNEYNEKGLALDFKMQVLSGSENRLEKSTVQFLVQDRFFENWEKMIFNTKNNPLKNAVSFHCKFDGLKIIRMIHFIEK
nr:glycosyltransferase [Treponemataceae bacterium]